MLCLLDNRRGSHMKPIAPTASLSFALSKPLMIFEGMADTQAQSMSPVPFENYGRRRKLSVKRVAFLVLLLIFLLFALLAGRLLVRDHPEKSDVIVVLAGDSQDQRYRRGMELLRAGYGGHLFLDASSYPSYFGHSPAEYAENFLRQDAGDMAAKVSVCAFEDDSTFSETLFVVKCLEPLHPHNVLIVTSDWHTARALSVVKKRA